MLLAIPVAPSARAVLEVEAETSVKTDSGLRVMLASEGSFEITTSDPSWTFRGRFGGLLTTARASDGEDAIGQYRKIAFEHAPPDARRGAIRAYESSPIVLFSLTQLADASNTTPLVTISGYPSLPYWLSYRREPFSPYQLN